jgi:membrane-anchored protein YejM (alkaline phosphatase superfamily)
MDAYTQSYEQAQQLMERRHVFDVSKEPPAMLAKYGDHDLGRQMLLGRRLLEQGITFVQVSHSNYDTHNENFNFHLEQMGEFDQSFSALIDDLAQRGMLESTLVVVMSEFGRTPYINQYYGRDHWGQSWSVAMAGCGIQSGAVIGKTNDKGTEVVDRQVDHRHLFHTYLRAVGLDSTGEFHVGGRDMPMADPSAGPIEELLA